MHTNTWIICEDSTRWSAALRMALSRDGRFAAAPPQLREVRRLAEAAEVLKTHPTSLLCLEVLEANLAAVLGFLPAALSRHPRARAVALGATSAEILPVLLEAGFSELSTSPRQMRQLLEIGRRHDAQAAQWRAAREAELPYTNWVWESLPWQAVATPVG